MLIAQIRICICAATVRLMHGRIDTVAALARCVAHVNRLDPRPDLVLATGDLVDLGLPEDYRVLLAGCWTVWRCRSTSSPAITTTVRDARVVRRSRLSAGDGPFLHYTIEGCPLRLIGLDTVLPGEVGGGLCA